MAHPLKPGKGLADHIAIVAARLFYAQGIHLVGVDRIAAEANITKRTLYRYYRSKDELIAAALRRSPRVKFPRDGTPADRIIGAFESLVALIRDGSFRGCAFINAAAELKDVRHPGRLVVSDITTARREWFRDRAIDAGASDPEALAEQLDVLFDGALANATKRNLETPAIAALGASRILLAASVPRVRPVRARRHSYDQKQRRSRETPLGAVRGTPAPSDPTKSAITRAHLERRTG